VVLNRRFPEIPTKAASAVAGRENKKQQRRKGREIRPERTKKKAVK